MEHFDPQYALPGGFETRSTPQAPVAAQRCILDGISNSAHGVALLGTGVALSRGETERAGGETQEILQPGRKRFVNWKRDKKK